MEDPNRPVTGYPAPNPGSNLNGYSANQPTAATAYPYAATTGAPPPNSYYNYQNNPFYQPDPYNVRRAILLRRVLAFAIAIIIVFAAIIFIVWLVLRPQLPLFGINSLAVSNFTLTNTSLLYFSAQVGLTARNPNSKMTLYYDLIDSQVYYDSWFLSDTMLPPFSQGTKNDTFLSVNYAAAGTFLQSTTVNRINGDTITGILRFNLRITARVRFHARAWRTRRRLLRVFCGDLDVGIPRNGSSGMLTGGPQQCRVGI